MSTPTSPSGSAQPRKHSGWLLTGAGVAIVAAIFIALNWFFSLSSANLDFTENKVHTLSEGTTSILKRVDTDVTIQLFVSPTDDLMPQFRPIVNQVEGWLQRYHELQPEHIKVQKFVVEPASDEEQAAQTVGLQPQRNQYFGIAITCLDKTALMAPAVDQDRIEFGLSAGITEVTAQKKKVVGLMTPLQLSGNAMPFGGRGQPAWAIYEALKSQYEVKMVDVKVNKIEDGLDVLLLIHPAGITDEAQWAVDQYLLKGGRVIAFLDPYSIIASQSGQPQQGMPPGMSPGAIPTGSNLPKLLSAWGYTFESDKIVADLNYATPMTPDFRSPILLTLGTDGIRKNSEVTKEISDLWFIYSGAYTGSPATGLKETILLTTSVKNQLVDTSYASANPNSQQGQAQMQNLIRSFKPEGKERLLALELTGKFKTAFPEGKPAPPPPAPLGGPGGGMGGLPPGMNFGPQGEEGAPGTPAPAADTKPAETAPAPAAEVKPATPAPAADANPTEVTTAPVAVETKPVEVSTPPVAVPDPLLPPPAAVPGTPAPAPIPAAPAGDPNQPPALKESAKDGLVYLVADSDLLADVLTPQILQNSNLPFALNLVDQAAGDKDLMSIRSRGSSRRPFDTLNNIRSVANEKIKGDIEAMNAEVEKINTSISAQKTSKDRNQALFSGLKEMETKQREISKRIYEKQKEANKEVKSKENLIQWMNILLMPLLIAGIGLAVWILRKVKTSAR